MDHTFNDFASAELFFVCHHMLAAATSPEVILLHGPGMCVPFGMSSPYKVVGNA
jgi:hypothetical protein